MKSSDYLTAVMPSLFAVTLADLNHIVAIFCALLGAAYLCWKWRRELLRR